MKINSLSTKKHYNIPKTLSQTESAQISSENVINKKNVRFFQKETDKLNANIEKKISKLQKINMNRNSIESNNLSQDYTNLQELKDLDGWVNQIQTPKGFL